MNSSSNIWSVLLLFAHKKDHLPHYIGLWQLGRESTSQLLRALQPSPFHKAYSAEKAGFSFVPTTTNRQVSITAHNGPVPAVSQTLCPEDPRTCVSLKWNLWHVMHTFSRWPLIHLQQPPCYTASVRAAGKSFLSLRLQRHHNKLQSYRSLKGRWLPVRRRTISTGCFCGDEITEFRFCIWSYMGFKGNIQ